ncbi:amino-acid N-acetyltransferase [Lapillicoccus sp.]|uniref:amino-acid N-acetyltransferase n=1 Tax=Lapillicoccus sp. TaxID=1909287 RepID=UPI003982EE48
MLAEPTGAGLGPRARDGGARDDRGEHPAYPTPVDVAVRRARTPDVRAIRRIVRPLSAERTLIAKDAVAYYESVHEFRVAEVDGVVVGCGALHVMWEDLAEIRTLAVAQGHVRTGVGAALLRGLIDDARDLGVQRVFCLTFETEFFGRHGFDVIEGRAVAPEVYAEMLRSYDEGVAEFLDLERVKPNTLGNTRMLLTL